MWWLAIATAWAVDLDEVRERAVQGAIEVERAEAERAGARADAWVTTAGSLPSVTGFASISTGQGFTSFGFERPVQTQTGVGARGQWVLLGPSRWAAAASARQASVGRAAMLEWARVDARREATARYASWWAASRELVARQTALADAEQAATAVEALVEAEIRPTADGARARADALGAAADKETAAWRVTATCAALQELLREPPEAPCDFDPPVYNAPGDGPASHPALDAAQAALAGAKAQTWSRASALGPEVSASGTAAWYATDGGSGGFGWSAGAEATVPLIQSGSGLASVASARADVSAAELDLEAQERSLRVALASAQARYDAASTALDARRAASEAADAALLLAEERYRSGTSGLTDWLDARRARDTAAVALAAAEAEVGIALAELEAARGVW